MPRLWCELSLLEEKNVFCTDNVQLPLTRLWLLTNKSAFTKVGESILFFNVCCCCCGDVFSQICTFLNKWPKWFLVRNWMGGVWQIWVVSYMLTRIIRTWNWRHLLGTCWAPVSEWSYSKKLSTIYQIISVILSHIDKGNTIIVIIFI